MGEDQYINILWLYNPLERFWPLTKVHSGFKLQHGDMIPLTAPVLPGIKAESTVFDCTASQTQQTCGWSGLSLSFSYSIHFLLLYSHSPSLGFNCFEAERSPQGAQQDVLQSFGETDY